MIDWDKIGSGNTPAPSAAPTSVPVAPAAPGNLPSLTESLPKPPPAPELGNGYHEMSQEQVNALDPGQRIGRGIDFLGNALFGRGNGSPLGGIPLLGDIVGGAGNVLHTVGKVGIAPIEAGAGALSRIPLGWLPGGADDAFNQIGEYAKTNDPVAYHHW